MTSTRRLCGVTAFPRIQHAAVSKANHDFPRNFSLKSIRLQRDFNKGQRDCDSIDRTRKLRSLSTMLPISNLKGGFRSRAIRRF